MDNTIIAAIIAAIGAVIAALIGAAIKKRPVEIDLTKVNIGHNASTDSAVGSSSLSADPVPTELEPINHKHEFMSDEYTVQLATELQMNIRQGDELRFVDKTPRRNS